MNPAPLVQAPELRHSPRFKPRGKVRITCVTTDRGPNLARGLVDVSHEGLHLQHSEMVAPGTPVVITVQRLNRLRPVQRPGTVRWSVPRPDGGCVAGVALDSCLSTDVLARLTEG